MRRIICSVKPKTKKAIEASTRDRIRDIEDRIDEIDAVLADPYVDSDLAEDLNMERAELEDDLRFAWADDEAEWDYAVQRQEFNPDGSLKGYGEDIFSNDEIGEHNGIKYGLEDGGNQRYYFRKDDGSIEYGETEEEIITKIENITGSEKVNCSDWQDDPNQDLYVVKIWYEIEANAEDTYGPEAAEEIIEVVANSPDQALERAKMEWSGPIDRIEIVDVNPEEVAVDEPFMASTDVTAAKGSNVKLQVKFDPYERYGSSKPTKTATVSGVDLLDALKKMTDKMALYIDSERIEEEDYSAQDIIDRIESENGDGCDFIYYIKNLTTGEVLFQSDYEEDEEEDWDQ